ncbi:MAG: GAF domain-containing protein [Flavisolibacter sp.]|nr:GAF domain-containing protein [Flavisolibacter sp.]
MSYVRRLSLNQVSDTFDLPFRIQFNFKKLIGWWEAQAQANDPLESYRAQAVLKQLEQAPELRQPFDNPEWIEKYQEPIQLLLSPFFPSLTTTNETKAAGMPFKPFFFNLTKRFSTVLDATDGDMRMPMRDPELMYISACVPILNLFYGANIQYTRNLFFDIPNKKTGILHRYRAFFNADFGEILPLQPMMPLTQEDIKELTNNFGDISLWKKKIPPRSFSFEGFTILTLFEVTREESISALEFDLLKKDALVTPAIVDRIRINLSALLNIANLQIGFVCYQKERDLLQPMGYGFKNSIILSDENKIKINDVFCRDSQHCLFKSKQTLVIPEVDENEMGKDPLMKKLVQQGLKSYLAMPLMYNDGLIGFLELGSAQPNLLNSIAVHKLQDVVPLFTTALNRSLEEKENRVEAIIMQKCTAIHPTVAWRFTEAAENLLERQNIYQEDTLEDIVFNEVYPLYGQADIQGSSTERNHAIQADLTEQLTLARNVLAAAIHKFALPFYRELEFRIDHYIQQLQEGLSAGDENSVLEFLHAEIYPIFNHLDKEEPDMREALQAYYKPLDPQLGMVYKKRKHYEQSVKLINDKISEYLDQTQIAAQNMFPHYFEKYKTDGVEHNLYIGQSMVNNKTFHLLYLKNLRLWQLMVLCEVENVIHRIKPQLKTDLQICSLILVHSSPLSIRFRMEEKKFDVDGTYNIRYEIIKKRIDKAYVRETSERLTQPGKIAIVYSQDKEALEYIHYLQYLQSINYVGSEIEWLTLSDMQGLTGLKALRVDVIYQKEFSGIKESKAVQVLEEMNES